MSTNESEFRTTGGGMAKIVVNIHHNLEHLDSSSSESHHNRERESGPPMPHIHDESSTKSMSGRLRCSLPPLKKFLDVLKPGPLRKRLGGKCLVSDEHGRKPNLHERKPDVRGDQSGKGRSTLTADIYQGHLAEIGGPTIQHRTSDDGNRRSEPVTNISGQWCNDVTETARMPASAVSETHARPLSPVTSLDSVTSISDTYSRLMLVHSLGYPLYKPEPDLHLPKEYRRKGLRIGDVGRVTPAGAFDFLFNTCLPTNQPINPPVLPDNFEVLQLNGTSIYENENFFAPETFLLSDNVNEKDDQFYCSGVEGAVLALPEGGALFISQDPGIFQEHAARHAESWYKYTTGYKGRRPANGSLYLVTGCIKSRTWGIATFCRGSTPENYVEFISNEFSRGSAPNAQATYRWRKSEKVIARIGPSSGGTCELNQCVYVYGYKVMLRQDVWDTLQYPVSDPSQGGENRSFSAGEVKKPLNAIAGKSARKGHYRSKGNKKIQNQNMSASERSTITTDFFNVASAIHPSDFINVMLLRSNPRARIALTHDTIWCDTLRKCIASDHFGFTIDKLFAHISDTHLPYTTHTHSRPENEDAHTYVTFQSRESNLCSSMPMSIVFSPSQSDTDSRLDINITMNPPKPRGMNMNFASEPSSSPASCGSFDNLSNMSSVTCDSICSSSPNMQSYTSHSGSNSKIIAKMFSNWSNRSPPISTNESRSRSGSAQSGSSRSDSP